MLNDQGTRWIVLDRAKFEISSIQDNENQRYIVVSEKNVSKKWFWKFKEDFKCPMKAVLALLLLLLFYYYYYYYFIISALFQVD